MKRFALILSFIGILFSTASAQTELTNYRPGITAEGAIYYLPKTNIRISVLVEKCTYKPGDFSKYAMRFLRLNNVSMEPSTTYRIVSISQIPVAVADTTKGFAV